MDTLKNAVASNPRPRLRTVAHQGSGSSRSTPAAAHTAASIHPDSRKLNGAPTTARTSATIVASSTQSRSVGFE